MDVLALPEFRFHPNPLMSGSVVYSPNACKCCRQARGVIYAGAVYADDDLQDSLCPWCIGDGSAFRKFGATFFDSEGLPDGIPADIAAEITERTPGFCTWQSGQWLECCGEPMAFLEPAGSTEVQTKYRELEGSLMMYIVYELKVSGGAASRLYESLRRDTSPTAFVFQCRSCESRKAYIDGVFEVCA